MQLPALEQTRLVVIRSAQGIPDAPPRIRSHTDNQLGAGGRDQLARLVRRLRRTGELSDATRLRSSNSRRAKETAEGLSAVLPGLRPEPDCGFCDPHAAEAEGREVEEWLATDARTRVEKYTPYLPKVPGDGESYTVGLQRAARAIIEELLANEGGCVVLVAGGLVLQATFWQFLGLPFHANYFSFAQAPTAITEWTLTGWLPGAGQPRARLDRFNDHAHLMGHRDGFGPAAEHDPDDPTPAS